MTRDEPAGPRPGRVPAPATFGLAAECRRQTALAAATDRADAALMQLLDAAFEDLGNWE